jgi:hypothetical protein
MVRVMRRSFSLVRASENRLLKQSFTNGRPRSISASKPFERRSAGIDLDREQAAALVGEWYLWFVAKYENEDADPEAYEEALWDIIEAMREFAPEEVREQPLRDMRWARDPKVRQGVRAVIADRGHTTQFLASRGLALTHQAHALFLDRVYRRPPKSSSEWIRGKVVTFRA